MSEQYLIAHKARGQVVFDVAEKMVCVKCQTYISVTEKVCEPVVKPEHCDQCNGEGHWWLISTFGHRAWPFWSAPFNEIMVMPPGRAAYQPNEIGEMPPNLRDFFASHEQQVRAKPKPAKAGANDSLSLEDLGL